MKKLFKYTLLVISVLSIMMALTGCSTMPHHIPKDKPLDLTGYEETFFDDFDTIDNTKWRFFNGDAYNTKHPDHIHRGGYYTSDSEAVFIKDSALHLSTRYRENGPYGAGWYTAWLESTNNVNGRAFYDYPSEYKGFAQQYGYFEVRCIAPPAEGMWGAFWLLPNEGKGLTNEDTQGTAKDGCEVDIMESQHYYHHKPYVQHVVHSDYGVKDGLKSDRSPIYKVRHMYNEFHTYGVEWTPDEFIFYIDGYETYKTKNVVDDVVLGTPQVPMSMIISCEIAGYVDENGEIHTGREKDGSRSWLGNINRENRSHCYDYVIDYVKVYKKTA